MAELIGRLPQPRPEAARRGERAHHRVRMTANIFGQAHHRHVDAMRDRRKEQRGRPGVVEHRHDAVFTGNARDRGYILHLEGQAARRFEEDQPRFGFDQIGDARADARIIIAGPHTEPREHAVAKAARRFIGAVDHQQMIARRQQRKQPRRYRCNARRIEQRALRPRFEFGQRVGQRPYRRRAAAAIIELVVRRMAARLQIGDAVV